jgi:hypothetical protein
MPLGRDPKVPNLRFLNTAVVEQAEIDNLIGGANQIRLLERLYNKGAAEILARLESGAQVESGNHTAEIETTSVGGRRCVTLMLR